MGKLETLFRKLSIPMPRPKVCLADALLCPEITQNHAAALAEALGSLAGKGFSSPQKALAWAKKKKLLPKAPLQPQLMGYEAAFMAFCFVRAAGVGLALEGEQLILQQSEGALLPQWSLAAAQWSLSAQLLQSRELAQSMDTPGLRRLVQKLCKALEQARQPLEKCYKLQLFGDSITDSSWGDCTTWVSFFPSRLGSGKAVTVNNAYGGGALSALPGKKNCVVRLLPKMLHPDADLVVVFASTNDFAANGPGIGLPGSRDKATLWGAVGEISQAVGHIPLLFIGPIPRCNREDLTRQMDSSGERINTSGWTLAQANQALAESAGHYRRGYLDLYTQSVFTNAQLEYTTIDGLHPNELGDILLASRIYRAVRQYLDRE